MFKSCLSYLLALMIALQSFMAMADIHPVTLDLDANHSEHFVTDNEPVHHIDNDEKHPECHHGHCHHPSTVFVIKENSQAIISLLSNKFSRQNQLGSSFLISPDLRPPIALYS